MIHRILATTLIALFGSVVFLPTAPANADFGCPGDKDSWRDYMDLSGTTLAARLRQHDMDGNNVCINLVAQNEYFGRSKWMSIRVCNTVGENCKVNEGYFKEHAGPVTYPANCVKVRSKMNDGHGNTIMDHWMFMGACN